MLYQQWRKTFHYSFLGLTDSLWYVPQGMPNRIYPLETMSDISVIKDQKNMFWYQKTHFCLIFDMYSEYANTDVTIIRELDIWEDVPFEDVTKNDIVLDVTLVATFFR